LTEDLHAECTSASATGVGNSALASHKPNSPLRTKLRAFGDGGVLDPSSQGKQHLRVTVRGDGSNRDTAPSETGPEIDRPNVCARAVMGSSSRPSSKRQPFRLGRHRWGGMLVIGAVAAVGVLLLSSIPNGMDAASPPAILHANQSSSLNSTAPYFPYLANASSYPDSDLLPNESGPLLLPQVADLSVAGVPSLALAYVHVDSLGNRVVEFRTGSYNASMAQSIAHNGCTDACTQHVPIRWSQPIQVATYGFAPVQQIALATGESLGVHVAIAVSSNNSTELYVSFGEGGQGSWTSLTGSTPVWGDDPQVLMPAGCSLYLTTINPNGARLTKFGISGQCTGPDVLEGGGNPQVSPSPQPQVSLSPPSVSEVVPSSTTGASAVVINGSGFSTVQQVLFGGAAAAFTVESSSMIKATVPLGTSPFANVSLWNPAGWSSQNCSDDFVYGRAPAAHAPQMEWVTPQSKAPGATVYVHGLNLAQVTRVEFGDQSASFSVISASELKVTVPSGAGSTNVTLSSPVGALPPSCTSHYSYASPSEPAISALSTSEASSGTVTITGSGFDSNATVSFGSWASKSVTYTSSTQLKASIPSGWGSVAVQASQWGFTSPNSCRDQFTFGSSSGPQLVSLNETAASSNSTLRVDGSNLPTGTVVLVGGIPAPSQDILASGGLFTIPQGLGSVQVRLEGSSGGTPPVCADQLTITSPSLPVLWWGGKVYRENMTLPPLTSAFPVDVVTPVGDMAVVGTTVGSTPNLAIYQLNLEFTQYVTKTFSLFPINESSGGVFSAIGDSDLNSVALDPAEVTAACYDSVLFVAMTVIQGGRTVLATLTSSSGGENWSGPYLSEASFGSIEDPSVTISPAGYAYLVWLEGVGGDWQLEQGVYSESGSLLQGPETLVSTGGSLVDPLASPSVVIDPYMRPFFVWQTANVSGASQIGYTGAFLTPQTETSLLWSAFNTTAQADFENFGEPGLSEFQSRVQNLFSSLESDLHPLSLCNAMKEAADVYANVTWLDEGPVITGPPASTGCRVSIGPDNSILSDAQGPTDPNFYMSVESRDLLESLGLGTLPIPAWASLGWVPPVTQRGAFLPDEAASSWDTRGDVVSTVPWTVTPDSIFLNTTSQFPGQSATYTNTHDGLDCGRRTLTDAPTEYSVQVQVGSSPESPPYTNQSEVPSVYVSNITALQNESWSETVSVTFTTTNQSFNTCPSSDGFQNGTFSATAPTGWPTTIVLELGGTFTTGLDPFPAMVVLNSTTTSVGDQMNDTLNWTNTLDATANLWLNASCNPSCAVHWANDSLQLGERASQQGLQDVKSGVTYSLTLRIESSTGLGNWSWSPIYSAGQVSVPAPVESVTASCSFTQFENPSRSWISSTNAATNITGTTALVTWYSQSEGFGWVTYNASGGGVMSAEATTYLLRNGSAEYVAELHGLEPWGMYEAWGHVLVAEGCTSPTQIVGVTAEYQSSTTGVLFQTLAQVPLEEYDLPYDSVTKEGGGAVVFWRAPLEFENSSTFDNGSITFYPSNNLTALITQPIGAPLSPIYSIPGVGSTKSSLNTTFGVNITDLEPNLTYSVDLYLNYTLHDGKQFVVSGEPLSFTYERDTTGDGLTDWEKFYGWNVTYDGLFGWVQQHVTANPNLYATNGLVGDYVEKEYGLNPATVDTSGSHMLDTWNLTFSLGPADGQAPTGTPWQQPFEYWYEETGSHPYDPFASTVEYSPGLFEDGSPLAGYRNISNVSASPTGGITSGDGSPWAAEVLWSYSALRTFLTLPGVRDASWLRAVLGYWDGIPTLTVEGKLSWGANPLAVSTPSDGLPDGARTDALSDTTLEFSGAYSTAGGQISTGTGYAIKMTYLGGYVYWYPDDDGGVFSGTSFSNYSSEGIVGDSPSSVTNYSVSLPVSLITQNVSIGLEVVANTSNGLLPLPINDTQTEINVTYDMVRGASQSISVSGSPSEGEYANLSGDFHLVDESAKVPTWLWIPTDNSTVNGLPLGLERYTGEQAFDVVVINSTGTIHSAAVPLPWGGTGGKIVLSAGLNAILVPREQFMDSPFGQAVFLGRSPSFNASTGAPPLIGTSEQSLLSPFGGSNWIVDLGAYWQNRSISSGPGNITGSTEKGVRNGATASIQLLAASSVSGQNAGGLPSDPGLYTTTGVPAAVQSVVTLNLSSAAGLDLLLASLIDNTTGGADGLNGTLLSITNQVGFLGFDSAVVNATPNVVVVGDGLYSAPQSSFPQSQPNSFWGNFWNAVTTVLTDTLGTIISLINVVWSMTDAAFTYFDHFAHEAAAIGAQIVTRTAAALVHVGQIIASALEEFVNYLLELVTALLKTVTVPISSAVAAYTGAVDSAFTTAQGDGTNISPLHDAQFWEAVGGTVFVIGIGLAVLLTVAVGVLDAFTGGTAEILTELLIPLLIGLAITAGTLAFGTALLSVGSFGGSAVSTIQDVFSSTWLDMESAWNENIDLASDITSNAPVFIASIAAMFHAATESDDGGPGLVELSIGMSIALAATSLILTDAAHNEVGVLQGTPDWPAWVNDSLVLSAILGFTGAVFGAAAARAGAGPEQVVGGIGSAVAVAGVFIELRYG
jgi:IPT/TIG domain